MPMILFLMAHAMLVQIPEGASTTIEADRDPLQDLSQERATSTVTSDDLALRLPRSAPDALQEEAGVFVQQTAHGQGSAFLRGLTGQRTVLMFDGIRLNNSTYRQGPNQYFFTVDSQILDEIQIQRGGASTRYGSDAMGGVIHAVPIRPRLAGLTALSGTRVTPRARLRAGTADHELGGRAQVALTHGKWIGVVAGAGYRRVGQLRAAGPIDSPFSGLPPWVPQFDSNGRTQLGTGFHELTADTRIRLALPDGYDLTTAAYVYRQTDAPRTDQCPAFGAPFDSCLTYDEQRRVLTFARLRSGPRLGWLRDSSLTLSWQQQREVRSHRRPTASVENRDADSIHTLGLTGTAWTRRFKPSPNVALSSRGGFDLYHDTVSSETETRFTDVGSRHPLSRGRYLDGSRYTTGGGYGEVDALFGGVFSMRGGVRAGFAVANAPADAFTDTQAVDRAWAPVGGHVGMTWHIGKHVQALANMDHAYRAPNLDDLTSRQQTGPGFQFENPELRPETADTYEVGIRARHRAIHVDVWGFHTRISDAITRVVGGVATCPPSNLACKGAHNIVRLDNAPGTAEVWGAEASITGFLPAWLDLRATVAWTHGRETHAATGERVPMSRIPPLNGTAALTWRHPEGLTLSAAVRWAAFQNALHPMDAADARIPAGGTPGFVIGSIRMSYRLDSRLLVSLALENVANTAYRNHGSSVNGPERSVTLLLDMAPW